MILRGAPFPAPLLPVVLLLLGCGILPGRGAAGEGVPSPPSVTAGRDGSPAGGKAAKPGAGKDGGEGASKGSSPRVFPREMCGGDLLVDEGGRGDRVLASVDGREIRASDMYRTFFLQDPATARKAVENEILYLLTRKEARRLGVEVKREEVEKVLERTIADHRARCAAYVDESIDLEDFVRTQYRMSFEDYRAVLGRTALFNLLLDRLVRYTEMGFERVQVGVIVVREREKAEEIRKKLVDGANLEVLARQNSLDRSAAEGGILAPIPLDARHPLYPLVAKAASARPGSVLDVDEVSIPKEKLYRVVKVLRVLEASTGSYREEAAAVEKSLAEDPVDLGGIQFFEAVQRERHEIIVEDS